MDRFETLVSEIARSPKSADSHTITITYTDDTKRTPRVSPGDTATDAAVLLYAAGDVLGKLLQADGQKIGDRLLDAAMGIMTCDSMAKFLNSFGF